MDSNSASNFAFYNTQIEFLGTFFAYINTFFANFKAKIGRNSSKILDFFRFPEKSRQTVLPYAYRITIVNLG
jgi:hypothetical protein